ncbi:MAG: MFS transporter [Firmicutes bacterium]|nr:MFS transporter [Bacillota bacterium]
MSYRPALPKKGLYKYVPALAHRNFRLFWTGQLVSLTGTWMQSMAQSWLVLELTGSPFLLGLVGAVQFGPFLLLSLFAGVLADRLPRRRLLLMTQSTLLLLALGLAVDVHLGLVRYWHVLVFAGLAGIANTFDMAGRQSFYVQLVGKEDLMNAIALNSSVFNAARIVGPAAAGLLTGYAGVAACFFFNALSFLAVLAGLSLMRLDDARPVPGSGRDFLGNIREGLRYTRATPGVLAPIMLMGALSIFAMNFQVLIPAFARIVLEQDARGYGFLMSAHGLGALGGALTLAALSHRGFKRGFLTGGAVGLCLFQLLLAPVRLYPLAFVLLVLTGWSLSTFSASVNTAIQLAVRDEFRGRVVSLYSLVFIGFTPIGSLISGSLARHLGVPAAMATGALAGMICAVFLSRRIPAAGNGP